MGTQVHRIHGSHTDQMVPVRIPFRFTLDGTNNPSVFPSAIKSVTRFSTAGGEGAYRVKFSEKWPIGATTSVAWCKVTCKDTENLDVHEGQSLTSGGTAADATQEIDLVVRNAGTATNSLTGNVVKGELVIDQVGKVS